MKTFIISQFCFYYVYFLPELKQKRFPASRMKYANFIYTDEDNYFLNISHAVCGFSLFTFLA